jgi:hypothetical protein
MTRHYRTVDQARRDEIAWDALVSGAFALREAEPIHTVWLSPYIAVQGTVADLLAMRPLVQHPEPEPAPCAFCGGSGVYLHEPADPTRRAYPASCPECS